MSPPRSLSSPDSCCHRMDVHGLAVSIAGPTPSDVCFYIKNLHQERCLQIKTDHGPVAPGCEFRLARSRWHQQIGGAFGRHSTQSGSRSALTFGPCSNTLKRILVSLAKPNAQSSSVPRLAPPCTVQRAPFPKWLQVPRSKGHPARPMAPGGRRQQLRPTTEDVDRSKRSATR
jgi:hypothetical protein